MNYQQIVHFLHQGKFPFDQDYFGFIKDEEVVEGIASLSFDPRGGKRRVVTSKKPVGSRVLLRSVQSEFRRRFKGEEVFIQNEVKVQFSSEFKEFSVPTSITQEELVSELIVEAKFHYTPEKTENREELFNDIPKPHVPKAKKEESSQTSDVSNQKEQELSSRDETFERKISIPEHSAEEEKKNHSTKIITAKKLVDEAKQKISRENTSGLHKDTFNNATQLLGKSLTFNLSPSTLSQLVPKSIQESSIQVRVNAPLATIPKRPPVLIPDTKMPEIKRSKIILHQLTTSLEKPVTAQKREVEIPYLNTRVAEKIKNERKLEQERQLETKPEEDVQKKLLEKKIASLFSGTLKPQKIISFRKPEKKTSLQILFGPETKVGKWYRAQKGITLLAIVTSITTISLVGLFFFSTYLLERQLLSFTQSFEQGSVIDAKQADRLVFAQNIVEKQLNIYSSVVGTSIFSGTLAELEISKKLSTLSQAIRATHEAQTQALLQFLGVNSGDPVETLNPSLAQADTIYKQLSLLEAELKQTDTSSFFQNKFTTDQQKDFLESLSEIRREVLVGQQLTTVLPNLLSKNKKRSIAIVLQDSAELRATGGFVQTVALLTISEGQISDIKILQPDEVSTVGEVTPPEEVTEYLGEKQWFLRDGNWNPNFETSAKQLASFIEKGTGAPVDGIIGLNTLSLAKLLNVTGGVTVKNESITEKNLVDREIFHARESLSESSGGSKEDFLALVLKSWLENLQAITAEQSKILAETVSDQLKEKELIIFSSDLAVQSTFGTLGWTGSIITPPCPAQLVQDQCVVSSVFQVDSNVGVNKVNYAVKKKVEHDVQITPDKIIHKRVITYENSSASNSWPGGTYKNYIRWYVPAKAKLLAVTVDGVQIPLTEIKQYQDRNFQVYGALAAVLPQTTSRVTVEYEEEPIGKQASFVFFDQKQPGTGNTPTKISMFYDESYVPSVIAPTAEISGEKIEFSLLGEEHSFVGVKFR